MKSLIKNSGIFLILLAVVFLAVYAMQGMISNTYLILSGFLLILGVTVYVTLQRMLD